MSESLVMVFFPQNVSHDCGNSSLVVENFARLEHLCSSVFRVSDRCKESHGFEALSNSNRSTLNSYICKSWYLFRSKQTSPKFLGL